MIGNQPIRRIDPLHNNEAEKRFDTSGRATAELISELEKRSAPNAKSSAESNT